MPKTASPYLDVPCATQCIPKHRPPRDRGGSGPHPPLFYCPCALLPPHTMPRSILESYLVKGGQAGQNCMPLGKAPCLYPLPAQGAACLGPNGARLGHNSRSAPAKMRWTDCEGTFTDFHMTLRHPAYVILPLSFLLLIYFCLCVRSFVGIWVYSKSQCSGRACTSSRLIPVPHNV